MTEFWKAKRVLVAGGAGFVGSHLVEQLVEDEAQVTVADNLESGTLDNLKAVMDRIRFIRGDLTHREFCEQVTREQDIVMNLAARAYGIGYSCGHQGEMLTVNTLINLHLLEAARKNGAPRFLLVSSSCVYPDDAAVPTPELDAFTGWPEGANAGYGWSKRMAELQAKYYAAEHGMQIAIVRPFNAYGGRYRWQGGSSHVIPSLVKKVMDGENPVVVWGSGDQERNFLHVRDFAWGMKLLTERYATAEPVNLGLEETVSLKQLVYTILRVSGKEGVRVEFDRTKPEGRPVKSADSQKLRVIAPEFRSRVSLEDGMKEMIAWYHRTFGDGGNGGAPHAATAN